MRDARLALLKTAFVEADNRLTIAMDGAIIAAGRLDTDDGRRAIESFFDRVFAGELKGPARVLGAVGHSFGDSPVKVVSLINLATVRDIERRAGAPR